MSLSTLRAGLRAFHLAGGIAISAFLYSSTLQSSDLYAALLQYAIVPALGLSGLLMWKPRLLRPVQRLSKRS